MFNLPKYREPDFTEDRFAKAPDVKWETVTIKGVAPENYHSTSMYPEYFKIDGEWRLAKESRMDSSVVIGEDGELKVVENRNLEIGDKVILGRSENAEEGIYLHATGFEDPEEEEGDQFVFRQGRSRETSFARDYDRLFELLKYEKEHGNILWVMGPAFSSTRMQGAPCRPWWRTAMWTVSWPATRWRPTTLRDLCSTRPRPGYLHAEITAKRPLQPSGCDQPCPPQRIHRPVCRRL